MNTTMTTQPAKYHNRSHNGSWHRHTDSTSQPEPLEQTELGGPFSLIDNLPLEIKAVPGMVLNVRKGSLQIICKNTARRIRTGERYQCRVMDVLTLLSNQRTELQITMA